ncbi:hypothetical protein TNCV_105941 [Trichonephila clavipes]|nr:hypothetical protein TNCV_105941 [Trichonephila clavipes]
MGRMFNLGLKKRLTLSPVLQSFQEEVQDSRINLFKELERKERGGNRKHFAIIYSLFCIKIGVIIIRDMDGVGTNFKNGIPPEGRAPSKTTALNKGHLKTTETVLAVAIDKLSSKA